MIKIAVCDDNIDYISTIEGYLEKIGEKHVSYDVYMSGWAALMVLILQILFENSINPF